MNNFGVSGMSSLTILFTAALLGLFFVVTWIIKSEMNLNACRKEIARLRSRIDAAERESFALAEKLSTAEIASGAAISEDAMQRCEEIERENSKLKSDLAEAKSSLEEVYKAIVSQG